MRILYLKVYKESEKLRNLLLEEDIGDKPEIGAEYLAARLGITRDKTRALLGTIRVVKEILGEYEIGTGLYKTKRGNYHERIFLTKKVKPGPKKRETTSKDQANLDITEDLTLESPESKIEI